MQVERIAALLGADERGLPRDVLVRGWVRTRRDSGAVCFLELNDGSCLQGLQIVVERGDDEALAAGLQTGASAVAQGELVLSPAKGQQVELRARRIELVGAAPDYPLQKKRHSFDWLRSMAHLRPRTNTFGAIARVRNRLTMAIHGFFQERGFLCVHTPIIGAGDAEGAGSLFRVAGGSGADEFFGRRAYLTVSGQLEAEAYACALGNVYTFGPTFRAEDSHTSRHLAEFWMIEPEVAFCDIDGLMGLAEDFLKQVIATLTSECPADLAFFDQRIRPGLRAELDTLLSASFVRISYSEAIERLRKSGRSFEYPPEWGQNLQSEHERYLTEEAFGGPVIVGDYPSGTKAFYMKQNDDARTVRAMDVLVPRLGEIIGGSQREDDLGRLTARMQQTGMNADEYWWYLDLRRYGSVPHSGFGLGLERLVQYVTGMANIRDVIAFPRTPGAIDF